MLNYTINSPFVSTFKETTSFPSKQELQEIKQRFNQAREQEQIKQTINALNKLVDYILDGKEDDNESVNTSENQSGPVTDKSEKSKIVAKNYALIEDCGKQYIDSVNKFAHVDANFAAKIDLSSFHSIELLSVKELIAVVEHYIDYIEDKLSEFNLYNDFSLEKLQPYKDLLQELLKLNA